MVPGTAMPSMANLKKELGVAGATITLAINDLKLEGLLVGRRGKGVYTTTRAPLKTVAFITRWSKYQMHFFSYALLEALARHAPAYGIFIEPYLLRDPDRPDMEQVGKLEADLKKHRIAGMLLFTGVDCSRLAWAQKLRQKDIPMLVNPVDIDFSPLLPVGVRYLRSQGAQDIALVHWNKADFTETHARFRKVLQSLRLEYSAERVLEVPFVEPLELAGYRSFMMWWNGLSAKPDGLICTNDQVTRGLVHAALDLAVDIPGQLKIVSHGNKGFGVFPCPGIKHMDVDIDNLAKLMLKKCRDALAGLSPGSQSLLPLVMADGHKAPAQN